MAVALVAANAVRWEKAKLTRAAEFTPVAKRLAAAKARYAAISSRTGVPWFVIAVIHEREASQRWDRSIAQGDPWNRKSTHVPKGRGPFASFEDAAFDALMNCAPFAGKWTDWSAGGTMTLLEHYNGLGYFKRGKPSPYIWSGTDQYSRGKYVADGEYNANAVDKQLGCAGLILAMAKIDKSVSFDEDPQTFIPTEDDVASDSQAVAPDSTSPPALPTAAITADTAVTGDPELFSVQKRLKARNYSPGMIDGLWGSGTSGALGGFINDRGGRIPVPASLDAFNAVREDVKAELGRAESEGWFRPVSEARKVGDAATVATIAPEVVPAKRNFLTTAWAAVVTFFIGIYNSASSYISQAWDFFTDNKDSIPTDSGFLHTAWGYLSSVPAAVWIFSLFGLFVFIAINSRSGVNKITESVQTGARQ